MRRLMIWATVTALAAVGMIVVSGTSYAGLICKEIDPQTGECLLWIDEEPDEGDEPDERDGPDDTGPGERCYREGRTPRPVSCEAEWGYWSNEDQCYVSLADPQPPADDPAWDGRDRDDGAVYRCARPQPGGTLFWLFWSADPPEDAGAGPTPREVAQIAIDRMRLSAIDIGIAPEPDGVGVVGMPVWMWAHKPDSHTWGPATASASAGGITITATARVHHVTWLMGDGTEVVCDSPGTPYEPAFGMQESQDCGHVFQESSADQPDGTYTVTAVSNWVVEWEGAGQSGVVRLDGLERSTEVTVGEGQVLIQ